MNPPAASPPGRALLEARLVSALPEVESAVRAVARRHCLAPAEAEDLASDLKLALVEDDYSALVRFEGRSSLRTYLVTVAHRLLLDRRRRQWGKWRPSSEARRLGPVALRLEELLYKQGLTAQEAVETLRTNAGVPESREDLLRLAQSLPPRSDRRPAGENELARAVAGETSNPEVQLEGARTAARAQALIEEAVARLEPEDRLVLRLRFEDEASVADIARSLGLEQKRLYRRIEGLLARFRRTLEERGLEWAVLRRMIDRGQCHLRLPLETPGENDAGRPSQQEAGT